MTVEEIKKHLRTGDMVKVAEMVGVSENYAVQLMKRTTAARHKEVVKAARRVARSNQKLGLCA